MRSYDISREYEMRRPESAFRSVQADINRAYNAGEIDLSEKHKLDAENHHRYINTPDPEDERAKNEQIKKFDFSKPIKTKDVRELELWARWYASYGKFERFPDGTARFLHIFGCVFRRDGDSWRFDHAERETL